MERFQRIPAHVGIIPDGNRRWAVRNGYEKKDGYRFGIDPGFRLYEMMLGLGIREATFYGFTKDNNKRAPEQRQAFTRACVEAVGRLAGRDANLLVVGNAESPAFPEELRPYANRRVCFGKGSINLNFLVNYDWEWDLDGLRGAGALRSAEIPRIDLLVRWGGRRRLSGFLPAQSVYADIFVVDEYWPDFTPEQFYGALRWYQGCDVTLGG